MLWRTKHLLRTPTAAACPADTVMFLNPAKEYLKALDFELPYYLVSPWAPACSSLLFALHTIVAMMGTVRTLCLRCLSSPGDALHACSHLSPA